jgi:hypothetical protein
MPPSGFKGKSIEGSLQFIGGCYEDLLEMFRARNQASYSIEEIEEVINSELLEIKEALANLHVEKSHK